MIDRSTSELENVLNQLTMNTDILEFQTFKYSEECIDKFTPFNAEILVYKLLREKILSNDSRFLFIDIAREYKLRDLIRNYHLFSEEEVKFIKNNSRLDFLLYNKIDKAPILAIEVDGVSFHNNELQRGRDKKKDHIMEVIGLPILRLSTDGYNEEAKIIENIIKAIGYSNVAPLSY